MSSKSKYFGRCLEGIESDSNSTIDKSRDSSSTTSGNVYSVLHPFESTVIFFSKTKKQRQKQRENPMF